MTNRVLIDFLYAEKYGAESEVEKLERVTDESIEAQQQLLLSARYRRDIVDKAIDLALETDARQQDASD